MADIAYNGPKHINKDGVDELEFGVFNETDFANVKKTLKNKQDKLTAGSNVTITGNTISATDTTYSAATEAALGLVKMGAYVAEAASTAPTAAEFKALLDSLKAAGIISSTAPAAE